MSEERGVRKLFHSFQILKNTKTIFTSTEPPYRMAPYVSQYKSLWNQPLYLRSLLAKLMLVFDALLRAITPNK